MSFTEKEDYNVRKILDGTKETPEDYIHDCVTRLFDIDVDISFSPPDHLGAELHKLEELNIGQQAAKASDRVLSSMGIHNPYSD